MKCSRVRDKLMDYTSADLSPDESRRIGEHLQGCTTCRTALESARRATLALNLLGVEDPAPSLAAAVRDKLEHSKATRHPVLVPRLAVGLSAAVLVAAIITGWMRYESVEREKLAAVKPQSDVRTTIGRNAAPRQPEPTPDTARRADGPTNAIVADDMKKPTSASAFAQKTDGTTKHTPGHQDRIAVPEPAMNPAEDPSLASEPDTERIMMIAVRPREPEIYVQHFESEEEAYPTALTVVREFDEGGNLTSVTINGTSTPDTTGESSAPFPGRTELLDAPLPSDPGAIHPYAGGSIPNV